MANVTEDGDVLVALIENEKRLKRWGAHALAVSIIAIASAFLFAGGSLWLFFMDRLEWAGVCLIFSVGAAVAYLLLQYVNVLLDAMKSSLHAQRVDFVRKETALVSICNQIADCIASEFNRLGYPKRSRAEGALEISQTLTRDLKQLVIDLIDAEGDVSHFFKQLRESEGLVRLSNLEGYLTNTGFHHEALVELFNLVRKRMDEVLAIARHSEVNAESAVRVILAATALDEALELVCQYHEDHSLVDMEVVRAAINNGE